MTREEILDEMLVLEAREGAREAFQALVERWQPRIFRHVRALVGRDEVAWDVVQEVWIAVGRGLGTLADPGRFRRWLYTVATRRASDWQRRAGREERTVSLEESGPLPVHEEGEGEESAEVARLRRALDRLPTERRTLLSLRYLDGFELWELSEILEVPEGTVKSRLHYAREELRDIYERTER